MSLHTDDRRRWNRLAGTGVAIFGGMIRACVLHDELAMVSWRYRVNDTLNVGYAWIARPSREATKRAAIRYFQRRGLIPPWI